MFSNIYNFTKYETELANSADKLINNNIQGLEKTAKIVENLGLGDPNCNTSYCKVIKNMDSILNVDNCNTPLCESFKSARDLVMTGKNCEQPFCNFFEHIDTMLKDPENCNNGLCNFVKNLFGQDFLSNLLMTIINFILGPFKTPLITFLIIIVIIVLAMFAILTYLIFFK